MASEALLMNGARVASVTSMVNGKDSGERYCIDARRLYGERSATDERG